MGKKSPKEITIEDCIAARVSSEELAVYQQTQPTKPKRSTVRKKGKFTIMPDEWWEQMLRVDADKCTYRVAHYLLREAWRSGREKVKVTNIALKKCGVGRD